MGEIITRSVIELSWSKVCGIVSEEIKAILGIHVRCKAIVSDNSHWCVRFIDYRLPLPMLRQLLQTARATPKEWEDAMPDESVIDSELGMELSERLISRHLKVAWEHRLITEDRLLLVGVTKDSCRFMDEQLAEIYRCVHETLDSGYPITAEREALLKDVCAQIQQKVPDLDARVMRSNEKELEAASAVTSSNDL